MDRLACIDVPALPLQLLLQEHPDWAGLPAAVVAEDRPQARLLWVNEPARRAGVLPGQRYAAALSLALDLRVGIVPLPVIARGVARLVEQMRMHTPDIEPAEEDPGVFWLGAHGFERLYGSTAQWAAAVQAAVERHRFRAHVAVGFTRFGTYAVAKSGCGRRVLRDPEEERRLAGAVPLAQLSLDPELRDALAPLAVTTVDDFLGLPAAGLAARFGPAAHRLHRLAAGARWTPLRPLAVQPARERTADVEPPDADANRLLFLAKRLLDSLLVELAGRGEALQALTLQLKPERGGWRTERLRPAAPTLDGLQLLRLVRLRLEALRLPDPLTALRLGAEVVPAVAEQLRLIGKAHRDPEAGARAFARVRAALGEVVVRARLLDAHLPGASFRWEPIESGSVERRAGPCSSPAPSPQAPTPNPRPLVRRIYAAPLPLPPRPRHEPDGWLLSGLEAGAASHLRGPYSLCWGWWEQDERRDYYFVTLRRGDVFWVYRDRRQRRWFLEGRVE